MKCGEVEKYIYLYKNDERTALELSQLQSHINSCAACQSLVSELEEFNQSNAQLKSIQPKDIDKQLFTNSIIKQIEQKSSNSKQRFIQSPLFRIAGIILIVLCSVSLTMQYRSINQSVNELEDKYTTPKHNEAFLSDYNDCIEHSESLIAQLLLTDEELNTVLTELPKGLFPRDIEHYASKICQKTINIEAMNKAKKKEIVLQILKRNRRH